MNICENKLKTALYEIDEFSPSKKKLSSNDINSWNQTHDKKIKFEWISSNKKKKSQRQISNIQRLKRDLSVKLQKSTPTTGRSSQLTSLQYQLINTKSRISQFKLPQFSRKQSKQVHIPIPKSKTNQISTKSNWNRASNPPTGRIQSKQMIEKEIRQHLEELKKPLTTRKIIDNNKFISFISKVGLK